MHIIVILFLSTHFQLKQQRLNLRKIDFYYDGGIEHTYKNQAFLQHKLYMIIIGDWGLQISVVVFVESRQLPVTND